MHELDRLTARFEIAVEDFFRSAFDLQANEKAYQAWYAASVIGEFGTSRVYREVHFSKEQLSELATEPFLDLVEGGNELLPDLSVSWREAVDARHTETRPDSLDALGMLEQFAIITEFKATASTSVSTPRKHVTQDLRKLGVFADSLVHHSSSPMATYMVILDNHRRLKDWTPTAAYSRGRMGRMLEQVATDWPEPTPRPVILVGRKSGMDRYEDFAV